MHAPEIAASLRQEATACPRTVLLGGAYPKPPPNKTPNGVGCEPPQPGFKLRGGTRSNRMGPISADPVPAIPRAVLLSLVRHRRRSHRFDARNFQTFGPADGSDPSLCEQHPTEKHERRSSEITGTGDQELRSSGVALLSNESPDPLIFCEKSGVLMHSATLGSMPYRLLETRPHRRSWRIRCGQTETGRDL